MGRARKCVKNWSNIDIFLKFPGLTHNGLPVAINTCLVREQLESRRACAGERARTRAFRLLRRGGKDAEAEERTR